ncbi:hypothetical protein [Saccharicrinis sp. GN24d3]|uniref:hypothetical protein n=1 Tax=Saccharicrinis sp. GN24d3 TaxID=3458416 RepID=UPI004035391B
MLVEVSAKSFGQYFPTNPHSFNSEDFVELNINKIDKVIRLVEDVAKPEIGLVAGIKDNILLSPFSAPFGGFHFKKENMYSDKVDVFVNELKTFAQANNYEELRVTLPPDIYHPTFNSKCVSAFFRAGFEHETPEITSYIDLEKFEGKYKQKNSREYYRQALRNELVFGHTTDYEDKRMGYELIKENRAKFGRPIYMTLEDIEKTGGLWPVDFFKVCTSGGEMVASSIFYRSHPEIIYAVFWGDNDLGRPLRAMDFMLFHLWEYYKNKGYKYVDLGISTEDGVPNAGLLRFKETHEATSSIRYRFGLKLTKNG